LSRGKDLFELRLVDTQRSGSEDVSLTDVGFGLSQLLPFIVQSLAKTDQIITIEQPEVHIHPKLQADLGDLVLESNRSQNNNQFLIETHSEHLILRFQRLIRGKRLKPNEISVLYVARGEQGSTVAQIRFGDDGSFIDTWPGGFFPERIRELMQKS
jgi:predicted ATPase